MEKQVFLNKEVAHNVAFFGLFLKKRNGPQHFEKSSIVWIETLQSEILKIYKGSLRRRCWKHFVINTVQAVAEEAGVRREDDDAADEAGVRETLYTLLLDHAHHARALL